ncbi:MAG: hypothetical protein H7Y36_05060 [Armatimonadetes bacterium]|nr:hypothetical protein [Akkermansiaceae bacterium]
MSLSQLAPKEISVDLVLEVIVGAERHHRIVWTAGRVLKEDGSLHQVMTGDPVRRKALLSRLRAILKTLAGEGVLAERGLQFNFGADYEVGYDLIGESDDKGAATDGGDSQACEERTRTAEQDGTSHGGKPPN